MNSFFFIQNKSNYWKRIVYVFSVDSNKKFWSHKNVCIFFLMIFILFSSSDYSKVDFLTNFLNFLRFFFVFSPIFHRFFIDFGYFWIRKTARIMKPVNICGFLQFVFAHCFRPNCVRWQYMIHCVDQHREAAKKIFSGQSNKRGRGQGVFHYGEKNFFLMFFFS